MKYFYLELNAFIVTGKNILNINKEKGYVFTSSWALTEQFININENNYGIIKSNLKLIKDSNIYIDKSHTMKKVFDAFNISLPIFENHYDFLINIMNTIINMKKYNDIDDNTLGGIIKLKEIRDIANIQNSKMRKDFMNDTRDIINMTYDENVWHRMTFELLARSVQRSTGLPIELIKKRYNGSLDRYIYATAQYFGKHHKTDRNDYMDLEHYKYIYNDIIHMVSDDKIMKFFDRKRVYTVNEFMKYMQ